MKTCQRIWNESSIAWEKIGFDTDCLTPQLILYFGDRSLVETEKPYQLLKQHYPHAHIIGCSTGGEICNNDVKVGSIVATLMQFAQTEIRGAQVSLGNQSSYMAGKKLGKCFDPKNLKGLFVLSDGIHVNGTGLVQGLRASLGEKISISGGLAGDGDAFAKTVVGYNAIPAERQIAAIGFYGDHIIIKYGVGSGWISFGPERIITQSDNNVLYALDGSPALDLYEKYLGDEAANLPGSALFFPLAIKEDKKTQQTLVRTVLSIDYVKKSMTFAGDMPKGFIAQMMRASFDNLIEGAESAALQSHFPEITNGGVSILVSCIGRRLLMKQSIFEEVEAVSNVWKGLVPLIGFYSYGEIVPQVYSGVCDLHNQTMTITSISERDV